MKDCVIKMIFHREIYPFNVIPIKIKVKLFDNLIPTFTLNIKNKNSEEHFSEQKQVEKYITWASLDFLCLLPQALFHWIRDICFSPRVCSNLTRLSSCICCVLFASWLKVSLFTPSHWTLISLKSWRTWKGMRISVLWINIFLSPSAKSETQSRLLIWGLSSNQLHLRAYPPRSPFFHLSLISPPQ